MNGVKVRFLDREETSEMDYSPITLTPAYPCLPVGGGRQAVLTEAGAGMNAGAF